MSSHFERERAGGSEGGKGRDTEAATPGRASLADGEQESVEWEDFEVGGQLAHLDAASGGSDGEVEKATTEREGDESEEREDAEGEGEVDRSFAPDSDSGVGSDDGDGDDDGDDAGDDDDDDDELGGGATRFSARATTATATTPAAAAPAAAAPADSAASKKYRDEIDGRVEQRQKVKKQPTRKNAAQNKFNNKKVKANHLSKDKKKRKHQIDRAGVRFRDEDKFAPIAARVKRYRIIEGNIATSDGVMDAIRSTKTRLAINPAHSRELVLEDGTKLGPCVLTWHGTRRAAWIPISQIKLATTSTNDPKKLKKQQAAIKKAVDTRATNWRSAVAGSQALKDAAHFKFGGAGAAPKNYDKTHYVVPNQRSAKANKVSDYLRKDDGVTFNVMINLPKDRQAPIAVDTSVTDDHFYVPKTGGVIQEISIYNRGKNETKVRGRQTWVFGHLGKDRETGGGPDEKRRGWVPLRVLDPVK